MERGGEGTTYQGEAAPHPRRDVKQARFGKLAFLQPNGAVSNPKFAKNADVWPFCTKFSVKNERIGTWPGNLAHFYGF